MMGDHPSVITSADADYTAAIDRAGPWRNGWNVWLEVVPVVNGQATTRDELTASSRVALHEAIVLNGDNAR